MPTNHQSHVSNKETKVPRGPGTEQSEEARICGPASPSWPLNGVCRRVSSLGVASPWPRPPHGPGRASPRLFLLLPELLHSRGLGELMHVRNASPPQFKELEISSCFSTKNDEPWGPASSVYGGVGAPDQDTQPPSAS